MVEYGLPEELKEELRKILKEWKECVANDCPNKIDFPPDKHSLGYSLCMIKKDEDGNQIRCSIGDCPRLHIEFGDDREGCKSIW